MTILEGIRIDVPEDIEFECVLSDFVWDFEADIHGSTRVLGRFFNFRLDGHNLVFDFASRSTYGDQFMNDYRSNNVTVSIHREPERTEGEYVHGILHLQVLGFLTMSEPPTTACDEPHCGKVFPAVDAYRSTKHPERLICPECFEKGVASGRYKMPVEGELAPAPFPPHRSE